VPEIRLTSCDLLILVEQAAKSVVSSDVGDLGCGGLGEWSKRSGLVEAAVWPVVVVAGLFRQLQGYCHRGQLARWIA